MERGGSSERKPGGTIGKGWKQWVADGGLQKWFRKDNLLIIILTGILLVIIALPTRQDTAQGGGTGASDGQPPQQEASREQDIPREASEETDADEAYMVYLEERLTEALSRVENVGEVRVMITLKASRELVVEKEQPVSRSSTEESDSLGGSRTVSEVDSDENTVYRTEGGLSEPYVVKTLPPQIEGVLVVAEGAGSGTVSRNIVEIVQALFDIEAHKVKVVRMRQPELP